MWIADVMRDRPDLNLHKVGAITSNSEEDFMSGWKHRGLGIKKRLAVKLKG